jgi:membrane-associated protein
MEQVLQLLRDYGPLIYGLLFAYCALKSGTLPLFAGFAAGKGALDPLLVVIFVFAGAVLGDEARFAAARRWGVSFLPSSPKVDVMMKRGISMAARYGEAYLFLYRYPKGMRTVGAFPIINSSDKVYH